MFLLLLPTCSVPPHVPPPLTNLYYRLFMPDNVLFLICVYLNPYLNIQISRPVQHVHKDAVCSGIKFFSTAKNVLSGASRVCNLYAAKVHHVPFCDWSRSPRHLSPYVLSAYEWIFLAFPFSLHLNQLGIISLPKVVSFILHNIQLFSVLPVRFQRHTADTNEEDK